MTNSTTMPFPESYWVVQNYFLAGEYPAEYDELETRHRLQGLIRNKIALYVDLTHPNDAMPKYASILQDEAKDYLKTVRYINHPIRDRSVPSIDQMTLILDEIDTSLKADEPVYVHCIAGVGRTGTVVGCHLVRHGVKTTDVLRKIQELRASVPSHWARSPESDEQVNFILNWKPGK